MSWAEEKAREAYLKFATNDWDMEMQGEALATVESAIRETIAKWRRIWEATAPQAKRKSERSRSR